MGREACEKREGPHQNVTGREGSWERTGIRGRPRASPPPPPPPLSIIYYLFTRSLPLKAPPYLRIAKISEPPFRGLFLP